MADQTKISKIYSLTIEGGDESVNKVKDLNSAFDKLRKVKKDLNTELSQALLDKKTTQEIDNLTKKIRDVEVSMKNLSKQREKTSKDALTEAKISQILADVKVKEAKATKELEAAESTRTKNLIQQEKELDRQIAKEEKKNKVIADSTGYYNRLNAEMKELMRLVKSAETTDKITFRGTSYDYDQAIKKLKELSAAEQDFRRQFTRDGTLVGEYTSGIVKAFRNSGMDDLIKNQIDNSKRQITSLNQSFEVLKTEYDQIKRSGSAAFSEVEQKMIENRKETQKLQSQVNQLETNYKAAGTAGDKMALTLRNSVSGMVKQMTTYAIGFFGFQKALSEINAGLDDATRIEGIANAFEQLDKPDLLQNLRDATRGTVSDLNLMKNAVQAKNFQVPLEQLASFFEFARRRAKDTGVEVGYLVDSIITGIGRKSPLILDNLGISAVRLREKLKGISEENATTGDVAAAVAQIIAEENANLGKELDTTSDKVAKNRAQWENLRTEFGTLLLPVTTALGSVLIGLASILSGIPWPVTTALITAFTAAMMRNYVVTQIATKQGLIYSAYLTTQQIRTRAVAVATNLATKEIVLFNGAIRISPLGIFLTLLTVAGLGMTAFASKVRETKENMSALNEVERQTSKALAEQTSELNKWYSVATNANLTLTTRHAAINKLITQFPEYFGNLKAETATLTDLKDGYDKLTKSIYESARAQVSAKLSAEKQGKATQVNSLIATLETELEINKGKPVDINKLDLTEDDRSLLSRMLINRGQSNYQGDLRLGSLGFDSKSLIPELQKLLEKRQSEADKYTDLALKYEGEQQKKREAAQARANALLQDRIKNRDVTTPEIQEMIDRTKKDLDALKINDPKRKELQAKINEYQKILDDLNPKKKEVPYKGSTLSGQQKDAFKDIDATRDLQIAEEKLKFARQEEDEKTHLQNLQKINEEAITKKLALLKGSNAEERKQIADLQLEKITSVQETSEKVLAIYKKQLKDGKEIADQQAEKELNITILNPTATDEQKRAAKEKYYATLLSLQIAYNTQFNALDAAAAKKDQQQQKENAQAIIDITKNLAETRLNEFEKYLAAMDKKNDEAVARINNKFNTAKNNLLNSDKSSGDKQTGLDLINRTQRLEIANQNLRNAQKKYDQAFIDFNFGKITEEQYEMAHTALVNAKQDVENAVNDLRKKITSLQGLIANKIGKLFNIDMDSEKGKLLGQVISDSFGTAQLAMNNYYDSEQARIEQSKQAAYSRMEVEKKLALNAAQSAAERNSIEEQFQAKKEKIDRDAFEKQKKMQRAQAAVNLAIQLSNLAVIAFSPNPANIATLGAAGAIMYAFQAALAIASYAMNISKINAAQFAGGGRASSGSPKGVVNLSDGRIDRTPNIPTQPNGDNILATVKTNEVILNEEQQRRLGGAKTFAAIGVPGFAGGGRVPDSSFGGGGFLQRHLDGGGTQAPTVSFADGKLIFGEEAISNFELREMIAEVGEHVKNVADSVRETDRKPVVAREVEAKNRARKNASKVGTI